LFDFTLLGLEAVFFEVENVNEGFVELEKRFH
jgi:hypothetical protein